VKTQHLQFAFNTGTRGVSSSSNWWGCSGDSMQGRKLELNDKETLFCGGQEVTFYFGN
jgi:hypothetical protein